LKTEALRRADAELKEVHHAAIGNQSVQQIADR
jgi:hypothetical protein